MAILISSVDMYYLAKELSVLEQSRFDTVYHYADHSYVFRFSKSGSIDVLFGQPMWLYLTQKQGDAAESNTFTTYLRKNIDGFIVKKVFMPGFNRVLGLELAKREQTYFLFFECYDRGNVLLCTKENEQYTIICALEDQEWANRNVKRGETFTYNLDSPLEKVIPSTLDQPLVKYLASTMQLGGFYAAVVCKQFNFDAQTTAIDPAQVKSAVEWLFNQTSSPRVLFTDAAIPKQVCVLDVPLDGTIKPYPRISDAYASANVKIDPEVTIIAREEARIKSIIEAQQKVIAYADSESLDQAKIGKYIQSNAAFINQMIAAINSKKTLPELKEEYPVVSLDHKKKTVKIIL